MDQKLIFKGGMKSFFHAKEQHVSKDFYDAANKSFAASLEKASQRASSNGRKTLTPKDL
jgi:histone H3/H4